MADIVARGVGCSLAREKEAIIGSDRRQLQRTAAALKARRVSDGKACVGAPYLGGDVLAGKRFHDIRGRGAKSAKRLIAAQRRGARLRRLRRFAGARVGALFTVGAKTASSFL